MEDMYFRKEPNIKRGNLEKYHYCDLKEFSHSHGPAIDYCFEDEKGFLFCTNGEYGSQVNFCPVCGYEAKIKISSDIEKNTQGEMK